MNKEFKHYGLRSSNRPSKSPILSTTAAVFKDGQRFYCYLRFSETLIMAAGKKLPFGVSEQDPAYLSVNCTRAGYEIRVCYFKRHCRYDALLWTTKEAPTWLSFHKVHDSLQEKTGTFDAPSSGGGD